MGDPPYSGLTLIWNEEKAGPPKQRRLLPILRDEEASLFLKLPHGRIGTLLFISSGHGSHLQTSFRGRGGGVPLRARTFHLSPLITPSLPLPLLC